MWGTPDMTGGPPPVVVPLVPQDLPQVEAIQRASFPRPWSEASLRRELELDWSHVEVVKEPRGGAVLAVVVWWLVGGEAEVLNLATRPDRRREGHAAHLLRHVLARAGEAGCTRVSLEVRGSNQAALAFYGRFGFERVGERPGYYQDDGEEAWILARALP